MIAKILPYLLLVCLISQPFHTVLGQIVKYDTKVTVTDDGKKTTKRTVLIQINNKDENWLSHVELNHNPKQEFKFDYAQIVDLNGGIVRKLKKKDLVNRNDLSYQTFHQDDLITEFDLYWNEYPYRIEYAYSIEEEEFLYLAWWTPLYNEGLTTIKGTLEIDIPSNYPIKINASEGLIHKASQVGDRKIVKWESTLITTKSQNEIYASPMEFPFVEIVPVQFKYGVTGKSDSWSSFGNWMDQLNQGTDQITPQEKWTLEKLTDGIDDRNEIIKTLYHYLQDKTKYVNVAIDVGGLKSYPASYVCENKYGDCKALTTYMKAMLKNEGIESFYTLVKAGEKDMDLDHDFPSQQFNHVILMIPSETDTIWLENTSNSLPFNYLGTFTQNRYALAINGTNSQLVKTPSLTIDDVLKESHYSFRIKNQDVPIDLDIILRGKAFEKFRYFISIKDEEEQKAEIEKLHNIKDLKISRWEIVDFHRDSAYVKLHVQGTSPSVVRQIGTFQVINPLKVVLPDFEPPNERKSDIQIHVPISESFESEYDLEEFNANNIQIPERIHIKNEFGTYCADYLKKGNVLRVSEQFILMANKLLIEDYQDFYAFLTSIRNYKKKSVILIE